MIQMREEELIRSVVNIPSPQSNISVKAGLFELVSGVNTAYPNDLLKEEGVAQPVPDTNVVPFENYGNCY